MGMWAVIEDPIIKITKREPSKREPLSPIKILAGGALNHKNPKQAPIIDPQNIEASPTPTMYGI